MSEGSTSCTDLDTESAYVFDMQDWETTLPIDILVTTHSFSLSGLSIMFGGGGG